MSMYEYPWARRQLEASSIQPSEGTFVKEDSAMRLPGYLGQRIDYLLVVLCSAPPCRSSNCDWPEMRRWNLEKTFWLANMEITDLEKGAATDEAKL